MFIGHYGASFAAKRFTPRTPLGFLFLAVQLLDVLFATFVAKPFDDEVLLESVRAALER